MELTTKQDKATRSDAVLSCDIVPTFRILKKRIDVQFNLGSELDFGPGFYITSDFEQARKFINKQVEVKN